MLPNNNKKMLLNPIVPPPQVIPNNSEEEDDVLEPLDESTTKEFHSLHHIKQSQLLSVTIFQKNTALVTRRYTVNVQHLNKEQIIRLDSVNEKVNSSSIRASAVFSEMISSPSADNNNNNSPTTTTTNNYVHYSIGDVSFVSKREKVQNDQAKCDALKSDLQTCDNEIRHLNDTLKKLSRQRQFLNEYRQGVVTVSQKDVQICRLMDASSIGSMTRFNSCYTDLVQKLDMEELAEKRKLAQLEEKRGKLQSEIDAEKPRETQETFRQIVVSLVPHDSNDHLLLSNNGDNNEGGHVLKFDVSYLISGASWKPTYDVRVNCTLKKLELLYYGIIRQECDEDWMETNVSLSTADPTDRASPMTLHRMTLSLSYGRDHYIGVTKNAQRRRFSWNKEEECDSDEDEIVALAPQANMMMMESMSFSRTSSTSATPDRKKREKKVASTATATAEQGTLSTVFHIPRKSSIPSDNSPHKVTITVQTFDAELSYSAVPKLDTNAYLKAETKNTSTYPILEGEMNVFVDNNFVSTGTMTPCNPNEDFSNFLGNDPSIKVTYAAPKRYKETVGIMKGSSKATISRKITVKNTKQVPVEITLVDQIPKSEDEKIKVKATYPPFKELEVAETLNNFASTSNNNNVLRAKTVKLTEQANVEWEFTIPESKEIDVELSYSVTWPVANPLDLDSL